LSTRSRTTFTAKTSLHFGTYYGRGYITQLLQIRLTSFPMTLISITRTAPLTRRYVTASTPLRFHLRCECLFYLASVDSWGLLLLVPLLKQSLEERSLRIICHH